MIKIHIRFAVYDYERKEGKPKQTIRNKYNENEE